MCSWPNFPKQTFIVYGWLSNQTKTWCVLRTPLMALKQPSSLPFVLGVKIGVAINLLGTFYVHHLLEWPFRSFAGHKLGTRNFWNADSSTASRRGFQRKFVACCKLITVSGIRWPWTLKTTVSGAQHSFSTRNPMNMKRAVLYLFVVLRIPESHSSIPATI